MSSYSQHTHPITCAVYATNQYTDEQLIALCQRQSLPSYLFAVLIERYQRRIYHACQRYLRHPQDAEDACQDVLIRVYLYRHNFAGRSSFKTWLHRIIRNRCLSVVAEQTRRAVPEELTLKRLDEMRESVQYVGSADQLRHEVAEALTHLSAADREVLKLRFFQDNSLEDIASALGLGLSAAKMRLYRALDRFRLAYEGAIGKL